MTVSEELALSWECWAPLRTTAAAAAGGEEMELQMTAADAAVDMEAGLVSMAPFLEVVHSQLSLHLGSLLPVVS